MRSNSSLNDPFHASDLNINHNKPCGHLYGDNSLYVLCTRRLLTFARDSSSNKSYLNFERRYSHMGNYSQVPFTFATDPGVGGLWTTIQERPTTLSTENYCFLNMRGNITPSTLDDRQSRRDRQCPLWLLKHPWKHATAVTYQVRRWRTTLFRPLALPYSTNIYICSPAILNVFVEQ